MQHPHALEQDWRAVEMEIQAHDVEPGRRTAHPSMAHHRLTSVGARHGADRRADGLAGRPITMAPALLAQPPDGSRLGGLSLVPAQAACGPTPNVFGTFPQSLPPSSTSFSASPVYFSASDLLDFQQDTIPRAFASLGFSLQPPPPDSSSSQHVVDMAGEVRQRPRNLSQSSSDLTEVLVLAKANPPSSVDAKSPTASSSPSSKKRSLTDTTEYPRRRAIIAVSAALLSSERAALLTVSV
jgi:hypothetical protein